MKTCTNKNCKQNNPQSFTNFYAHKRDGYQAHCKVCQNERNKDPKRILYRKEYYSDPEVKKATSEYVKTPERKKAKSEYDKSPKAKQEKQKRRKTPEYKKQEKEYRERPKIKKINKEAKETRKKRNPIAYSAKTTALTVKRNNAKLKRTPKWLTKEQFNEIEEFYTLSYELRWLSEEQLQVDHIVPLQGKNVSGLHVPWNLQILPKSQNRSKHNGFDFTYDNNGWKDSKC